MQQILDKLKIKFMGKHMPQLFVNACIGIRRTYSDEQQQRKQIALYLDKSLATELSDDERATFVRSIMNLDSAITSVELE